MSGTKPDSFSVEEVRRTQLEARWNADLHFDVLDRIWLGCRVRGNVSFH